MTVRQRLGGSLALPWYISYSPNQLTPIWFASTLQSANRRLTTAICQFNSDRFA